MLFPRPPLVFLLLMYWYWLKLKKTGNQSEILSVCLNSWQKRAYLPPVERRRVPTCSVLMLPSTCRWMRQSQAGLVLSAISLPSLTLYRSMGNVLSTDTFFFFFVTVHSGEHSKGICCGWQHQLFKEVKWTFWPIQGAFCLIGLRLGVCCTSPSVSHC